MCNKPVLITFNKQLISLIILFNLLYPAAFSQEKISKTLLAEDLDVLKQNLETYHTGLYTYTSKKEFDNWFADTKRTLKDSSPLSFFNKVNELNLLIKNGHTFFHINPEQRGKDLLMPSFNIYKDGEQFYIKSLKDGSDKSIIGKKIIAVNHESFPAVFNRLLKYEERDGNNLTQPTEELQYTFARKYALAFGNKTTTTVTVESNQVVKNIVLKNIPMEAFSQKTDDQYENGQIEFSVENGIGRLVMPTFNEIALEKQRYKQRLKSIFDKIEKEKVQHLIIDIRNNGGGDTESVEELISYLYNDEFTFYTDVYQLHKKWDHSIIPDIHSYPKNTSNWALKKGEDGFFRGIIRSDGMKKVKPKKQIYAGKLYVLINGSSLSAAAEFASFIRQYRPATFIGDEAGGNKVQNTSGYSLTIGLPHSKIIVSIPVLLWKMNVSFENNGYGIKPDHFVRNTIAEEMASEDSILRFAYQLIDQEEQ